MSQWLVDQWFWCRRFCMRHGLTAAAGLVLVYFVFHGLNGERGYFAKQDTQRMLHERQELLDALIVEREALETKVSALTPGRTQADMVEEQLYQLGYIKPGDVIIFKRDFLE